MATSSITAEAPGVPSSTGQTDSYELVLLNSSGTEVLLRQEADRYRFPSVDVPRFTRRAEMITSDLRESHSLETILLWSSLSTSEYCKYLAVLEVVGGSKQPAQLKWISIDEAISILGQPEADLMGQCRIKALKMCFGSDPEPFSRLGWIQRITKWVNGIVQPIGMEVLDFIQLNGAGAFSLVKFSTNLRPLWFKAVGEPNVREFPITLLLSRLFPSYLPRVIAQYPEINGWLMESSGESSLRDCGLFDTWRLTVQRLARLQIDSIGRSRELLQAGCRDATVSTLTGLTSRFFGVMEALMEEQTKATPSPLTPQELKATADTIQRALALAQTLEMPDTLGHADFNPGNVLLNGASCSFIDWAEALVGNPFLTFEYFLNYLRRFRPSLLAHEAELRRSYSQRWLSLANSRTIELAFRISPLIAVYAYAVSGQAWQDRELITTPRVAAYLRSLGRRMKREADSLRSALCLS